MVWRTVVASCCVGACLIPSRIALASTDWTADISSCAVLLSNRWGGERVGGTVGVLRHGESWSWCARCLFVPRTTETSEQRATGIRNDSEFGSLWRATVGLRWTAPTEVRPHAEISVGLLGFDEREITRFGDDVSGTFARRSGGVSPVAVIEFGASGPLAGRLGWQVAAEFGETMLEDSPEGVGFRGGLLLDLGGSS